LKIRTEIESRLNSIPYLCHLIIKESPSTLNKLRAGHFFLNLLIFCVVVLSSGSAYGNARENGFTPGQVPDGSSVTMIVTLRDQLSLAALRASGQANQSILVVRSLRETASEKQANLRRYLEEKIIQGEVSQVISFWIFNGMAVTASPEVFHEIARFSEVERIVPNTIFTLPPAGQSQNASEYNLNLVNAPSMWELGFQGQGVVVANLDTGVSYTHPDLIQQWRGGANSWFDPYGQHKLPADQSAGQSGHGTKTMGIMVGRDAGGTSVGMAPRARWIAAKIFNNAGSAELVKVALSLQWVIDPDGNPDTADGAQVVNNSWTFNGPGCVENEELELSLAALRAAGILPVFAGGNFGPGESSSASPGNYPEAFSVGSTNAADSISPSSSLGPSGCLQDEFFPDLVAPGVDIRSTTIYNGYDRDTGTSFAAPHVAGALALLLDAYPELDVQMQEQALIQSAVDLGDPGPDPVYGHGRLDVLAAYEWLHLQLGPPPTRTPTPTATLEVTPSPSGTIVPGLTPSPTGIHTPVVTEIPQRKPVVYFPIIDLRDYFFR
jgi:subtilisin family serine protease